MVKRVITRNTLFHGDNLPILREQFRDESVDLIYLDPPFNSNHSYHVLYKDESNNNIGEQLAAFKDMWYWNDATSEQYQQLLELESNLSQLLGTFVNILGKNQMTAYLVMMAVRLLELHRVLKSTGSLYLHCDPTASHYLKMILDIIFGSTQFINEISWERSHSRSLISRSFRRARDIILFYAKTEHYCFNIQYRTLSGGSLKNYRFEDEQGSYRLVPLLVSGTRKGKTGEVWRGIDPNKRGKTGMHWVTTPSQLEQYDKQGKIVFSKNGTPSLKYYLNISPGAPLNDNWTDIPPIQAASNESLAYPTQKPFALLERIIQTSSNPNDVILDPFCGSGTMIHAAQQLGRRWISFDINELAISLIKKRLLNIFGMEVKKDYDFLRESPIIPDIEYQNTVF